MKYRKKPVVIEAMLFKTNNEPNDANLDEIVEWVNSHAKGVTSLARHDSTQIYIATIEGTMTAQVGDYIIRGVSNEFYPCKPDIFALTYEPVEESKQ